MPRVKILQDCYNGRQKLKVGAVVEWPLEKGESLPKYVELLDEDDRPAKGKGKGKASPAPDTVEVAEDEVI